MDMTGWASAGGHQWSRHADASLPYSDHADYNELLAYVHLVQPKQVFTVNGFPELAARLRKLGYEAMHLNEKGQIEDSGFQMKML
jgi:Cft2 family RNA processing exonuclease